MKVLLINPGSFAIGVNEASVFPPVGLVYIATLLNKSGFDAQVYDAELKKHTPQQALEVIKKISPRAIGLKLCYYNISWSKELITALRRCLPSVLIGFGGPVASYDPSGIIGKLGGDFAISGEGEMAMLSLAKNLSAGRLFYDDVPGVVAKNSSGEYYFGPENARINNLDCLPFPDYDLVGGLKAYSIKSKFSPAAPIFATRGCLFRCSFCSKYVFRNTVTFRSPENVVQEIRLLKERHGIRQIDILDDNFTVNRNYAEETLDLIIKENINLAFDLKCGVRVESLDEKILEKMRKAGVYKIAFGIESADKKVLDLCNKQLDIEKLKKMAIFAKKIGFNTSGFFIIGLPGETRKSLEDTIALAQNIKLDVANFCIATPFPGTDLYDYIKAHGKFLFDPQGSYDFGYYGHKAFYSLPDLDADEIVRRFNYAYKKFYDISRVLRYLKEIKTVSEFKWFFSAFLSLLKGKFKK